MSGAVVASLFKPKGPEPKCSFCGTPKSKANKFVSGLNAHICGACVVQAKKRVKELDEEAAK